MTVYRFVDDEKAAFPMTTMCRLLGVSPSGFWAWTKRPPWARAPSDVSLTGEIRRIHLRSRGTYSVPRASTPSYGERKICTYRLCVKWIASDGSRQE